MSTQTVKARAADVETSMSPRQAEILAHARDAGEVQVDWLATEMGVTPQTIRRDLKQLCDSRMLQRVHGGAVLFDGVANLGYEARKRFNADGKREIARTAAALVPDDSSVIVNIGTTTEAVAAELVKRQGLLLSLIHI